MSRDRPDRHWAYWLAQMLKVSLVAFLVGGAFLNLAYWDVPYYLFVAIAVTRTLLRSAEAASAEANNGELSGPGAEPESPLVPVNSAPLAAQASGKAERT